MQLPKQANLWLPGTLRASLRKRPRARRLWVALTDHYEPLVTGKVGLEQAKARVGAWRDRWPDIALSAPLDATGKPPCFTFFYPQEEYHPELVDTLAEIARSGLADVEVHIHHANDTRQSLRAKLSDFLARLENDHGLLHRLHGERVFGFIHGNWALDNSLPGGRACGVTGELELLRELGCYADFTMPSVPSPTQSRIVNQIYWTTGSSDRPRGFDTGIEAAPGAGRQGTLLMVEGPLGLRWRELRIETGELAHYDPPTPYRVDRWLALAPQLGEDIFLKLFGHSAREDNAAALIGSAAQPGALGPMFHWIHQAALARNLELHWVSAWNMYRAIDAIVAPPSSPPDAPPSGTREPAAHAQELRT
ncbi:MAG: hypothetical protein M3O02_09800 [Acidobacteriota bacterium]|nr:hypothetical protein [Acidobacteriota bacterium]